MIQSDQFEKINIKSIMKKPAAILKQNQDMHSVMEKFDITQSWYLPVLDKDRKFIGVISKIKLLSTGKYFLLRAICTRTGNLQIYFSDTSKCRTKH